MGPITLEELQSLIGSLTNDPNHDRYSLSDINTELDITQDQWNIRAGIIKETTGRTIVSGTRSFDLGLDLVTGLTIAFTRCVVEGIDLKKRSKSYFDLYTSHDWTTDTGTPTEFYVDTEDALTLYVHPTPGDADAGKELFLEFVRRHSPMAAGEWPFMTSSTDGNSQSIGLRPYDYGLAYDVAARLLTRDPSPITIPKIDEYKKIADGVLADIIQTYKAFEKEEPYRLRGGRRF